ncbi:hypothetical protein BDN72DRAFT_841033 [Pluteus cervinus]|uniref:Uncharacterized protein n=1 Tax=Pluteus cervinus TaxID=181527 RepID=A0ACD3ATZ9_9AGAR|nr:hypothetical protein BDN72DRAFT_841033 [Pluteus cervinus]
MLTIAALLALAPFASALSVSPLQGATSQGNVTITWDATAADPPFSIELTNPTFNNAIAIENNINPGVGTNSITLILPVVPAANDYTLQLVNPGNISDVFAQSATFSIAPVVSSSSSASATGASSGASSTPFSLNLPSSTGSGPSTISNSAASSPSGLSGSNAPAPSGSGAGTFNGASEMRYSSVGALLAVIAGAAAIAL